VAAVSAGLPESDEHPANNARSRSTAAKAAREILLAVSLLFAEREKASRDVSVVSTGGLGASLLIFMASLSCIF
jgi:hypothetical protein